VTTEQDKSEIEAFTSVEQKQEKHRGSQLLVVVAVLLVVAGGLLAISGRWYGFALLIGGFAGLFGLLVWSLKNWDY
jgi:Flp pilus assembly protein TadB